MSPATGGSPSGSGRFPSASRVRKRVEFLSIQERGQRVSTPRFVLILSASANRAGVGANPAGANPTAANPASAGPGAARLGITASRKVGNAVVRARAKRLIREAFRATRALWPAGIDVVVIVKRSPGKTKLESVVSEWEAARPQIERKIRAALARAAEKPEPEA